MNLNASTEYTTISNNVDTTSGHFGSFPKATVNRSRYSVPFRNTLTCNASDLVPFYWSYVMPNETFSVDTSAVIRMQPTVHSPMSNVYADIYYFFVPAKDLWTSDASGGFKEFMGETRGQYDEQPLNTYQIPQLYLPSSGFSSKSVADYLGVPPLVANDGGISISALPFRAYGLVWNNFFRDENISPECVVYTGSSTQSGKVISGDPLNTASLGGDLLPVCRPHDMLGSCLPFPMKGDPTDTLVSGNLSGAGRVLTYDNSVFPAISSWTTPLKFTNGAGVSPVGDLQATGSGMTVVGSTTGTAGTVAPSNLWLNTASTNVGSNPLMANISINELRTSIALQHYFEALARGGSRYYEVISSLYGTTIDPMMIDRPVYLGGKRVPISITNVIQNTPTGEGNTGLGSVAGYSCTSDYDNSFTFSFSQHGIVLGVLAIRSEKQYQQGLDRNWRLKERLEFYTPNVFDGLGEMEVPTSDIYFTSNGTVNNSIFGYQEAYYWERYRPAVVSGEFRSSYATSLDSWHLADNYDSQPYLAGDIDPDGRGWIYDNTRDNLDRVLQVSSSVSDQFYCDIYVDNTVVSPLPVYSVPGIATL